MSYRLRVAPRAARQMRQAAAWWIENRPKAPNAFAEDLDEAFRLIRSFPSLGARRWSTPGFQTCAGSP